MNFLRAALSLPLLALSFNTAPAQTPNLAPADQTAIRAVLDRPIESWNHHDMKPSSPT